MEVLLTRGDLSLVGELASLKDSLNVFRKRAKRVSKENQVSYPLPEEHVLVRESSEEYCEMMMRSCDLDNAFHDVEPMEKSSQYSISSSPIYRMNPEIIAEQWLDRDLFNRVLVLLGWLMVRIYNLITPQVGAEQMQNTNQA